MTRLRNIYCNCFLSITEGGSSFYPCAETYAGTEAFSEVEMKAVRDQILAIKPRVYLTVHSYAQMWLYPWGYTADLPENWEDLVSNISYNMR